jgi:hypothetical protein
MTYNQGVRIATRTIAIYLIVLALLDVLALADTVPALIRVSRLFPPALPNTVYAHPPRDLGGELMWTALAAIVFTVAKIAICLAAARWFYVCGSWLQRFFGGSDEPPVGEELS